MFFTILFIHIVLCIILVVLVLMQQGKGADMGAAFGGSSNSLFGAGGGTDFVTKLTTSLAVAFMVTSILLVRVYTSYSHSGAVVGSNPLEGSVMKPDAPLPETLTTETTAADKPAESAPAGEIAPAPAAAPVVENKAVENNSVDNVAKAPDAKPAEVKPEEKKK